MLWALAIMTFVVWPVAFLFWAWFVYRWCECLEYQNSETFGDIDKHLVYDKHLTRDEVHSMILECKPEPHSQATIDKHFKMSLDFATRYSELSRRLDCLEQHSRIHHRQARELGGRTGTMMRKFGMIK